LTKEIVKLKVDEISLVDSPANKRKFLIVKRDDDGEEETIEKDFNEIIESKEARERISKAIDAFNESVREVFWDEELEMSAKTAEIVNIASQFRNYLEEEVPEDVEKFNIEKMINEIQKETSPNKGGGNMPKLDELLANVEDEELRKGIKAQFDVLEKRVEELEDSGDDEEDTDIDKSALPEEVKARFEEMEKRAQKAEDIAKAERSKRLDVEFQKRAKQYSSVGETEKIKNLLKKSSEVGEEFNKELTEILSSAQERLSKADLFKEQGDSGESVTDAESQIEKATNKELEANPDLTRAQAQREALRKNADLYSEYLNQSK